MIDAISQSEEDPKNDDDIDYDFPLADDEEVKQNKPAEEPLIENPIQPVQLQHSEPAPQKVGQFKSAWMNASVQSLSNFQDEEEDKEAYYEAQKKQQNQVAAPQMSGWGTAHVQSAKTYAPKVANKQ